MKSHVSALVAALFLSTSFQVSASDFWDRDYSYNTNSNYNHNSNTLNAKSTARASSTVVNSTSNSVTNTDSGQMHYSGGYTLENVPDAIAPNVYPTSPCMGSSSMGGAGVGFGISFGTSWKDDDCGVRETARSFAGMGMKEDALAVLCSSEYAKSAPSCKKYIKVEE